MSTEPEHEIVPRVRAWLAAMSDVAIPTGLSRDEARRRARDFLVRLAAGSVTLDSFEGDGDSKDVLCALVEELDQRSLGSSMFEDCDRAYQFVSAIAWPTDHFGEQDDILQRIARIGWRSAPGGLEAVLKARAAIWEHGDEKRHREVCETADELPTRIQALSAQRVLGVAEAREICARLVKLANIRPTLVAPAAAKVASLLDGRDRHVGWLDDHEHLKAMVGLAIGMAGRQLGKWDLAESGYRYAVSAIHRIGDIRDLDRLESERVALQYVRTNLRAVVEFAPGFLKRAVLPRERVKVSLIFASALIDLDQPKEARSVLESARQDPGISGEPVLLAWLHTRLGNALSCLRLNAEAMDSFKSAGAILNRFHHPLLLADLTAATGEHLTRLGDFRGAAVLYGTAREVYRQSGQLRMAGYLSVLLAELMMLLGRDEEAEAELLAALPLIERFDLRREAVAAVALLREALAKRRTDVKTIQALRDQLRKGLH